jgi:hypothetical protein
MEIADVKRILRDEIACCQHYTRELRKQHLDEEASFWSAVEYGAARILAEISERLIQEERHAKRDT